MLLSVILIMHSTFNHIQILRSLQNKIYVFSRSSAKIVLNAKISITGALEDTRIKVQTISGFHDRKRTGE